MPRQTLRRAGLRIAGRRSKWYALAVIAISQFTVVIDLTIVNVALPNAQVDLRIASDERQWVVTAYALTFGSLLLLGGRVADFWGRRRAFMAGLSGFAAASAVGGVAETGWELFAARALQGLFGALLAPAALALLQVEFPRGRDRTRAFSIFGTVAGGGAAVGSTLGGLLTEYASWRWCLLVNVPVVVVSVIAAAMFLDESRASGATRYDIPGALTATSGLAALVFGLTGAAEAGWRSPTTISCLAGGVGFLVLFVAIEVRSLHPLLPLRVVLHRGRGGSLLTALLAGIGVLGTILFLTYYFQTTRHYSPLRAGFASLPGTAVFFVGSRLIVRAQLRFAPRWLMGGGAAVAAAGMLILTRIGRDTPYWQVVLPGQLVQSIGLVALFIPLSNSAMRDVDERDAGAAGGMFNATQQIGGAIGTALLSTVYATASTHYLARHPIQGHAVANARVHGYTVAFGCAAIAMVLAAITAIVCLADPRSDRARTESECRLDSDVQRTADVRVRQ